MANTVMVTLANGRANSGYVPNDAAFGAYTFQVLGSRLKPGCAEQGIANTLTDLVAQYDGKVAAGGYGAQRPVLLSMEMPGRRSSLRHIPSLPARIGWDSGCFRAPQIPSRGKTTRAGELAAPALATGRGGSMPAGTTDSSTFRAHDHLIGGSRPLECLGIGHRSHPGFRGLGLVRCGLLHVGITGLLSLARRSWSGFDTLLRLA